MSPPPKKISLTGEYFQYGSERGDLDVTQLGMRGQIFLLLLPALGFPKESISLKMTLYIL